MFTLRSLMAVARAAALNLDNSAFVATDFSVPLSNADSNSVSYASVFGILFTLTQIASCCLAAGDDGLQEVVVLFLDEGNQVRVAIAGHDEDPLSGVLRLVRVRQDIQQAT
mgnify:CR=1 FL=1